jgi:hypothetical protein
MYPGNIRYVPPPHILCAQSSPYLSQSNPSVQCCTFPTQPSKQQLTPATVQSVSNTSRCHPSSEHCTHSLPCQTNQNINNALTTSVNAQSVSALGRSTDFASFQSHVESPVVVDLNDKALSQTTETQKNDLLIFDIKKEAEISCTTQEVKGILTEQQQQQQQQQQIESYSDSTLETSSSIKVLQEPKRFNLPAFKTPKIKQYEPYEEL